MTEIDHLPMLLEGHYMVPSFGARAYVPLRVLRRQLVQVLYSPFRDIGGFNGAAASQVKQLAAGAVNLPTIAALPANSSVSEQVLSIQGISNLQDMFRISTPGEMYQVFYGISPSYLRMWTKQPQGEFATRLDQGIFPFALSDYHNIGAIDGFDSPLERPSEESEFLCFYNISASFGFANPVAQAISGQVNFVINKMRVEPVTDEEMVRRIFRRVQPAHWRTVGEPLASVPFDPRFYSKRVLGADGKPVDVSAGVYDIDGNPTEDQVPRLGYTGGPGGPGVGGGAL